MKSYRKPPLRPKLGLLTDELSEGKWIVLSSVPLGFVFLYKSTVSQLALDNYYFLTLKRKWFRWFETPEYNIPNKISRPPVVKTC